MALDTALLRVPVPSGGGPEPLAISIGALGLIRSAAERTPLVLAIDDVQWLDAASASVIQFVLRRLDDEPIAIVLARRTPGSEATSSDLLGAVAPDRRRDLPVAVLPVREMSRLLAAVLGLEAPPSTVARIHQIAGGNPFYAVEIGRAMQRRGMTRLDGGMGVPASLSGLLEDRLAHLSPPAVRLVEHAAALSEPSIRTLEAVLGREEVSEGLRDAIRLHVLEAAGDHVRFTHPLLAAAGYGRLADADRRGMHRRLAEVVTEVEERATHIDLSSDGSDEEVASALEAAAIRADGRGAPEAAAGYAERAARRTSGGDLLARRRLAAGKYHRRAGDMAQARAWLESALREVAPGTVRSEILLELGEVQLLSDDWDAARELLDAALAESGDDRLLRIDAMVRRAGVSFLRRRDRDRGSALIDEAMRLAEECGDPLVIARVIGPYASWQWARRRGGLDELERRAEELAAAQGDVRIEDQFLSDFALVNAARGRHERARALFERRLEHAEDSGDYGTIPALLANMTRADFYGGRSDAALARLAEAERLARITGQETALSGTLSEMAIVNARTGRPDAAWKAMRALMQRTSHLDRSRIPTRELEELAVLELSRRDYRAALDALAPMAEYFDDEDAIDTSLPTRSEALIGLGLLGEAEEALRRFARLTKGQPVFGYDSADVDGGAARVGALLAAARGDLGDATRRIEMALAAYAENNDQWSRARALLVAADIHRRARRRAQAREAATESLALFEYFGAALWAERARDLVERTGAVREVSHRGLTPTQVEIVELAIQGLTNRQIGNRLFMSRHTVEAHLSSAFRALGIRSRRQLEHAMRDSRPSVRGSVARPKFED